MSLILTAVLLVPMPPVVYRDGGTRDYRALLYRVVVWNRLTENSEYARNGIYHKVSVYLFPQNRTGIDELWQLELKRIEK